MWNAVESVDNVGPHVPTMADRYENATVWNMDENESSAKPMNETFPDRYQNKYVIF